MHPRSPRWVYLLFPPLLLLVVLLLLIVFVVGPCGKRGGGHRGLPQLRHGGPETMGVLGGSDAMQQLFEERGHASQENTISPLSD